MIYEMESLSRKLIIPGKINIKNQTGILQTPVCKHCFKPWRIDGDVLNTEKYISSSQSIDPFISHKTIYYTQHKGHFALCNDCWNNTTLDEKLWYYTLPDYIKNNDEYFYNMIKNILSEHNIDINMWLRKQKLKKLNNIN